MSFQNTVDDPHAMRAAVHFHVPVEKVTAAQRDTGKRLNIADDYGATLFTKVKSYFLLLPPELREKTVIAGGAAVDYDKASDVDLWVMLDPTKHYFRKFSKDDKGEDWGVETNLIQWEIARHLESLGFVEQGPDDLGLAATFFERVEITGGAAPTYMKDDQIAVAFNIYQPGMKKAQIMFTTYPTVGVLLNSFDISTHMVAYTFHGERVTTGYTTEPDERPEVVNANAVGGGTPSRLIRIGARYGFPFTEEDALAMAAAVNPDEDFTKAIEAYSPRSPRI